MRGRLPFYIEDWDQYHCEGRLIQTKCLDMTRQVGDVKYASLLVCPSGINAWGWDPYKTLQLKLLAFRNGVTLPVKVAFSEADIRHLRRGAPAGPYMDPDMMVFTHYAFNGRHQHYGSGYPFSNLANEGRTKLLSGAKKPADTWMQSEGTRADLGIANAVFRHLERCNFSYLDGHAQSLGPLQVDGQSVGGWWGSRINDARLLYAH